MFSSHFFVVAFAIECYGCGPYEPICQEPFDAQLIPDNSKGECGDGTCVTLKFLDPQTCKQHFDVVLSINAIKLFEL